MSDLFDRLAEPFPADAVSWRVGSTNVSKQTGEPPQGKDAQGIALAYLDARDVMDRLDYVCGPDGWQCRYSHVGVTTVCDIGVRVREEWIWKADGAGATDVEAEKGMLSDAFKRSAVRWGIGRYLYGLPSPWVTLEKKGRSWIIKQSEYQKLTRLLNGYSPDRKSSAEAKRHGDFEYFKAKLESVETEEELGAIGREIKQAKPHIPVQFHDPLTDVYTAARERIREANPHQMMDEEFRNVVGRPSPNGVAGRPEAAIA